MAKPAWKVLEDDVAAYFQRRAEREAMGYHRFYDTHAAGNFLPHQPGDHLVVVNGLAVLIETKCSEKYASLYSCFSGMVKPEQIGSMIYWERAGAHYFVVFKSTLDIDTPYELWLGADLVEARKSGKRLKEPVKTGRSLSDLFEPLRIGLYRPAIIPAPVDAD